VLSGLILGYTARVDEVASLLVATVQNGARHYALTPHGLQIAEGPLEKHLNQAPFRVIYHDGRLAVLTPSRLMTAGLPELGLNRWSLFRDGLTEGYASCQARMRRASSPGQLSS
jgi:hypothetical protein